MANKPIKSKAIIHAEVGARYAALVKPAWLKKAVHATLAQQRVKERVELTIVITGNVRLRALNRQYRQIDAPTDVLSFPTFSSPAGQREAGGGTTARSGATTFALLGDIAIARGVAGRQARAAGHAVSTELRVLALHGVLHLLGYDHETDDGEMARVEARLRRKGGLTAGLIARAGQRR